MSDLDVQPSSSPLSERQDHTRAAREALVGKSIAGRYVIHSLIGHGGMGAVYEAEHLGIGKRVAIKFVDQEWITDDSVLRRFAREARALSALESAHIVQIFDAGTEEGRPYLVMELLRGEDLGQRLRRVSRIPLPDALHTIAQVLKGLAKAHAAGVVHRDLKPDNVFLVTGEDARPFAKIVDFGVSKIERPKNRTSPLALTGRGTVLGTPFYMSPEQAQAMADLDGRADLFSVGAILFECLSGRPPHTGETYEQIILSICMNDAPDLRSIEPSVPAPVAAFVARALSRDRAKRFASAEAMLAALVDLAPDERVSSEPKPAVGNKTLAMAPPPASVPFQGGSTQIAGSGSVLDPAVAQTAPSTPIRITPPPIVARAPTSTSTASPASSPASSLGATAAAIEAAGLPSRRSPRRSTSAVIATAVVASLLGVAATFGIIAMLGKKEEPISPVARPSASAPVAVSTSSAPPTITSAVTSAAPPEVSAAPSPTPAASDAPKRPTTPTPTPTTPTTPTPTGRASALPVTAPKPGSSKALDISRELP